MLLQALPGWQEHGYRLKCLTRNQGAGVLCRQRLCHTWRRESDEGTYHLLERKAAWPQQQAKNAPAGASLTRRGSTLRWPGISPVRRQKQ
jgi:hypothetical protein